MLSLCLENKEITVQYLAWIYVCDNSVPPASVIEVKQHMFLLGIGEIIRLYE